MQFCLSGVVSADTMRVVDRNADGYGVSAGQRMESAGSALASVVRESAPGRVLILCGTGNNGGDGLVAARYLCRDADTRVICCGTPKTPESRSALAALEGCPVTVRMAENAADVQECAGMVEQADVVVDALLGTGARLPLREPYASFVRLLNGSAARVISCDLPTPSARSDLVAAFHLAKTSGARVCDIGIPPAAEVFCGEGELLLVPRKPAGAHKGAGGSVLVVGGGPYQGAPFLAGLAALRAGADVVRVAAPVDGFVPDLILDRLPGNHVSEEHAAHLCDLARQADVVVCGPGLGTDPESLRVAGAVVREARRAVADADLLRFPLPCAREQTIFTPHAGEFARVFGEVPAVSLAERGVQVRRAAADVGGVILLKGAVDTISDGVRVRLNRTGAPGMTTGGTGDALAGCCGGLLARMDALPAAAAAAFALGKAGMAADADSGDGMTATDLLRKLGGVLYREV